MPQTCNPPRHDPQPCGRLQFRADDAKADVDQDRVDQRLTQKLE
jgi:hypothetical protein